jgi:hypothetical protein
LSAGQTYWVGIFTDVDTTLRAQPNPSTTGYQMPPGFVSYDPFPDGSMGTPVRGNDWASWLSVQDAD